MADNPLLSVLFPLTRLGALAARARVLQPPAPAAPLGGLPPAPAVAPDGATLAERARIAALNEMAALDSPKPQAPSKANTLLTGFVFPPSPPPVTGDYRPVAPQETLGVRG